MKSLAKLSMLLMIGLFVVAAAPVRAASTDERINALEEELLKLKGEQAQIKEDATAARAALPSFSGGATSPLRGEGPAGVPVPTL